MRLAEEAKQRQESLRDVLDIKLGSNLGYFGPHEPILRSFIGGQATYYSGCNAGRHTLGIESDGTIKGCPSLPTEPYRAGNVRDVDLHEAWRDAEELSFTRESRVDELWGF